MSYTGPRKYITYIPEIIGGALGLPAFIEIHSRVPETIANNIKREWPEWSTIMSFRSDQYTSLGASMSVNSDYSKYENLTILKHNEFDFYLHIQSFNLPSNTTTYVEFSNRIKIWISREMETSNKTIAWPTNKLCTISILLSNLASTSVTQYSFGLCVIRNDKDTIMSLSSYNTNPFDNSTCIIGILDCKHVVTNESHKMIFINGANEQARAFLTTDEGLNMRRFSFPTRNSYYPSMLGSYTLSPDYVDKCIKINNPYAMSYAGSMITPYRYTNLAYLKASSLPNFSKIKLNGEDYVYLDNEYCIKC